MTTKSLLHSSLLDNLYYNSMLVGNEGYEPSDEDILAETILASSQTSVTFSSLDTLAAGYQDLQIRATMRSTRGDTDSYVYTRFNGDETNGNYDWHGISGNGTTIVSERYGVSRPYGIVDINGTPGANAPSGSFGILITDILNPFDATKKTTVKMLSGQAGTYNRVGFNGGLWLSTAAVTSISFVDVFGQLAAGTRITLIGLK